MTVDEAIGANLRKARTEKNIKQEAVAHALNVSRSVISKIENGQITISLTILLAYCQ